MHSPSAIEKFNFFCRRAGERTRLVNIITIEFFLKSVQTIWCFSIKYLSILSSFHSKLCNFFITWWGFMTMMLITEKLWMQSFFQQMLKKIQIAAKMLYRCSVGLKQEVKEGTSPIWFGSSIAISTKIFYKHAAKNIQIIYRWNILF